MFYLIINNMAVHLVSVEPELGNKVLLYRFCEQNHLGQPQKNSRLFCTGFFKPIKYHPIYELQKTHLLLVY